MAYLGNVPAEAYSSIVKDTFSGNNTDVDFTLSRPATTNGLRVVISDVIQEPSVDYTCTGTTLTFTSAPATGTDNIYVVHLDAAVQTVAPPAEINFATTFTAGITVQGNIAVTGTVDGRDVATDGTKLDGIESNATADQTAGEIKTAYESNSNTNAFTDAEQTKLAGIETGATADQTASEILTAIKTVDGTGSGLDADTVDGIEASSFLQANQTITLSGDASGSGTTSIVVTVADDSHNHVISNVDGLQTALDAKAPLASPTFTGTPLAPTATSGTNTTQIATTAFVQTAVSGLVDSAPATLDTLNELAAALGDDANFSTTVTNSIATKLALSGGTMTGNIAMSGAQTVDGRDLSVDGAKLDGIESGATADQTAAEILTAIKTVDGAGSGLDADLLDGQSSAYYATATHNHTLDSLSNTTITANSSGEILKWNGTAWVNNTLSEAGIQPAGSYLTGNQTITLSGDVSGSGTTAITVTVADDSHNHIISNVDGLQTALDAKLASSSYTASDVLSKLLTVDGAGSGLDADLLDGISSASFLRSDADDTYTGDLTHVGGAVFGSGTLTADGQNDIFMFATSPTSGLAQSGAFHNKLRVLGGSGQSRDLQLYQQDSEYAHIGSSWTSNQLTIDSAFTQVNFNQPLNVSGSTVWHAGNDGSGSGLDADTLDGVQGASYLRSDAADTKTSGDLSFSDSVKATFGNSADLEIYHDGTHSRISDVGTGNLRLRGTDVRIESNSGADMLSTVDGAGVTLYYNNVSKFATTSTGSTITDNLGVGTTATTVAGYDTVHIGASTIGSILRLEGNTAGFYHRILNNNGDMLIQADQGNAKASTNMIFYTDGTERARIDTSGNLKFNSGYGSAGTAYGCRAWINFNGQGTPTARASGNVSSITDIATGQYAVNFSTAMPDANYASVVSSGNDATTYVELDSDDSTAIVGARATTSCRIFEQDMDTGNSGYDQVYFAMAIFR